MLHAHSSSFSITRASSMLHRLVFAPCFMHTPPFQTRVVHPSLLHRLTSFFAPCLQHTPPFTALFVHLSILHRLTFAPCLTHTPPFTAKLVHPSPLHRLTSFFAPCL